MTDEFKDFGMNGHIVDITFLLAETLPYARRFRQWEAGSRTRETTEKENGRICDQHRDQPASFHYNDVVDVC